MPIPIIVASVAAAGSTTATAAGAATVGTTLTGMAKVSAALKSAKGMLDQFKGILDTGRETEGFSFGSSTLSLADKVQESFGLPSNAEHAAKVPGFAGALVEMVTGRGRASEPGMDQSSPSIGG